MCKMFAFVPDVNECEVESPCQHHCYNLIGSFLCQCDHGFELAADTVSCEGEPKNQKIQINAFSYEILPVSQQIL